MHSQFKVILVAMSLTLALAQLASRAESNPSDSNAPATRADATKQQATDSVTGAPPNRNSTRASQQKSRQKQAKKTSSTSKPANRVGQPQPDQADYLSFAQSQARSMLNYKNTPPLFVTSTRDLFVDVARYQLGTKLTTIQAVDDDGDQLEYSIHPANFHDASGYFAIQPTSGELRLANKQLPFHQSVIEAANASASRRGEQDDEQADESSPSELKDEPESRLFGENLYFLNIGVDDGHYTSFVELLVHVINSSALETGPGRLPVQLAPDGGRKANEQMEDMVRRKAHDFYERLHKAQAGSQPDSAQSPPAVVYPDFVNPSLARPEPVAASSALIVEPTTPISSQASPNQPPRSEQTSANSGQQSAERRQSEFVVAMKQASDLGPRTAGALLEVSPVHPQPMLISLVVVCSCLMLALVLLMFIVPLSVKKLRKRLKQMEHAQHEALSQRNSHGSTICSSSIGSTSGREPSHNLASSMSQFGLGSSVSCITGSSSVCRQTSLDSTISTNKPQMRTISCAPNLTSHFVGQYLNRLNNGSIDNPVYLPQHLQQQQLFYQPLDDEDQPDEFYTTINADFSALNPSSHLATYKPSIDELYNTDSSPVVSGHYNMAECEPPPPFERPTQSPNGSDSGSSTRSLARFLSLPARHASHQSQSRGANSESNKPDEDIQSILQLDPLMSNHAAKTIARGSNVAREQQPTQRKWEIERHKIKLIKMIGAGQFGQVWMCKLKQAELGSEQTVAVKMLKSKATRDERGRADLLAEIEIMKLVCKHPNVVKILYCCTDDTTSSSEISAQSGNNQILLVMEYLELGKLQSYLEKSRLNHLYATSIYHNDQTDNGQHLTSRDLIKFIYHVAKGMEYIAAHCIVHRDLASRNILVSSKRICKIGDFGMARLMQSPVEIYERHSKSAKIPVRWMAPEVLVSNAFTSKSDVFSFGILMWEIVTLGATPYRHLETSRVIKEVARNGLRPERPTYCHPQLFKIMSQCWSHNSDDRPTFKNLVSQLDALLLSANDYIELDQYPDHNYYNIPACTAPYELV